MNILGICGSIRHNSTNHAALAAVRSLLPKDCGWEQFEIKSLPFFEPDNQWSENIQASVKEISLVVGRADVHAQSDVPKWRPTIRSNKSFGEGLNLVFKIEAFTIRSLRNVRGACLLRSIAKTYHAGQLIKTACGSIVRIETSALSLMYSI
jgi:hypothetical protein